MLIDNDDSDENLMLAYQTGNQKAFACLYQRYRQTLFAYLVKTLGQKNQAEEQMPRAHPYYKWPLIKTNKLIEYNWPQSSAGCSKLAFLLIPT